jgi:energy-coupling factor transporter ATP-binding protein EcfA2
MIQLSGVSYIYPEAGCPALREIDLTVRDGEWLLLAGPSGCGKSTLLYLLNGLAPQVLGGTLSGEVRVDGFVPGQIPIREVSRHVGTVFQNPETQLFMLRVGEDVAFGCENLAFAPSETHRRVERALAQFSLTVIQYQEVFKLSGGQKQRLAIAGATAMGCRTLLLDEPTSDLDDDSRVELIAALSELHRAGHTIIMTEHRLEPLIGIVDRMITMEVGRIVSNGPFPVTYSRVRNSPNRPTPSTEILVDARELDFAYSGGKSVLKEVSFSIGAGEIVALKGRNGSGKTTLLKLLCGLLRPTQGCLTIAGRKQPRAADLVGEVGFLFQNPDEQLFTDSVVEEIVFGPDNLGRRVELDYFLNRTGLTQYRNAHPRSLSRGERQRLAAAAVLAMGPKVILLDEPTTGLDQPAWAALMELVVEQARHYGACVVFSTHHAEVVETFASRVLTISQGRLVDDCLP